MLLIAYMNVAGFIMMLLRAKDNNIQSFEYIWLHKGNQNKFLNSDSRIALRILRLFMTQL